MGLRIRTNVQSLTAQRHLGYSRQKVSKHAEKLASGFRINKAADDAAGLAIAENLRADVRSLYQAKRNANDAIAMLLNLGDGGRNSLRKARAYEGKGDIDKAREYYENPLESNSLGWQSYVQVMTRKHAQEGLDNLSKMTLK